MDLQFLFFNLCLDNSIVICVYLGVIYVQIYIYFFEIKLFVKSGFVNEKIICIELIYIFFLFCVCLGYEYVINVCWRIYVINC